MARCLDKLLYSINYLNEKDKRIDYYQLIEIIKGLKEKGIEFPSYNIINEYERLSSQELFTEIMNLQNFDIITQEKGYIEIINSENAEDYFENALKKVGEEGLEKKFKKALKKVMKLL
jgi:hypothetical protein